MTPIKLTATVQPGGTLTLDHLPFAAGESVEVVLSPVTTPAADPTEGGKYPLRGTPGCYIDPFEPACDPDEWEVMK
jgi:hypothetical protein